MLAINLDNLGLQTATVLEISSIATAVYGFTMMKGMPAIYGLMGTLVGLPTQLYFDLNLHGYEKVSAVVGVIGFIINAKALIYIWSALLDGPPELEYLNAFGCVFMTILEMLLILEQKVLNVTPFQVMCGNLLLDLLILSYYFSDDTWFNWLGTYGLVWNP